MKRRIILMLALALVASAPLAAWAVQQRAPQQHTTQHAPPASHAIGSAKHDESARSEEAPSPETPKPINCFDYTNHEQPAYGAMLLNFALMAWMYYALGRNPAAEALSARRAGTNKEIEESGRMHE